MARRVANSAMPPGMKRNALLCTLLLAACGGGGKKTDTTAGAEAGGGATTETGGGAGGGAAADDPALAARKAFASPGGMWTPAQMKLPQHAAALSSMGVALPAANLSDPLAAPLNAVVSLGGCTASFVSPEGLVVTNHHCVQGALNYNSTPESNLVENGFLAKTQAEEKSAGPSQKVMVAQAFKDVTADMTGGLADIADPVARKQELEKREKALLAACEKDRPGIRCDVKSFFRGAEFTLIEYLEIRDVRLVYVPARSVGNYGGEIDNWAWPRHTGDFSFYRAYVGKDGQPADYAPDNVPFKPKHWLKVASKPLAASDFVMITGYPGRTSRVTTFDEVKFDVDWRLPYTIELLQQRYAIVDELVKKGGATAIKAGVAKQGVQNGLEKSQGVLAGLQKGDMLAQKQAIDAKVRAWADAPGHEEYKAAIAKLDAQLAADKQTARADFDYAQALGSSHLRNALLFVRMAEERTKPDADRKPGYQDRDLPRLEAGQKSFVRTFDATLDRALWRLGLVRALELPEAERPWLATLVGAKKGQKIDAAMIDKALDGYYAKTTLADEKLRLDLLKNGTTKQLKASKDPFIKLAVALWPTVKAKEQADDVEAGEAILYSGKYATAMREALGGFVAPDANSTLRITYGTVRPFEAGGKPFTVASEIPAKNKGEAPFDAPKAVLDGIKARNYGPYADAALGDLPVNFIADLDITGGNSGSPVLNDRGELVGLAFDGNIEGVASDVVFNHATTRAIMVDARYMMWVMDLVDGADNVLEELGVKPSL